MRATALMLGRTFGLFVPLAALGGWLIGLWAVFAAAAVAPNRPILIFFKIAFSFQDFLETKIKIIFQDFGKIILKMNLEKKSRSFFKILAKICLNKIIDFTI